MMDDQESPRKMFTRQQYFNLMISSGSALSHDYTDKSKEEDPRMLAFFDSFIQREVDHSFSSDSSDDSALSPDSLYLHFVRDHSDANSSDRDDPLLPSLLPPELGIMSNSESDLDSHLIRKNAKPDSKRQGEERSVSTSSDAAGCSADKGKAQTNDNEKAKTSASDAQEKSSASQASNRSEGSNARRRGRHRSRSSTDSSSSSGESDDFLVMRYRSRLLRRIMRQKSKKSKDGSVSGKCVGASPSQVDKDKIASLQQRIAFSRVMKERITIASESDSSLSDDNEHFLALVGQLRQRTDSARQRAASLRRHRMRALAELTSLTGDRTRSTASSSLASRSPQRESSTNATAALSRLQAVASSHSSPSNSPRRVRNGHAETAVPSETTNSTHTQRNVSCLPKSKSKASNSKSNRNVPSTSNGEKCQCSKKEAAGCSTDTNKNKTEQDSCAVCNSKGGVPSKNGFKKFKVNSSGKKRHYRSKNCYSRQNDSDSD